MSRFLVTGALGCIGAWTLYHLTQAGKSAVVLDVSTTPTRPRLLMDDEQVAQVQFIQGDITDLGQVERHVQYAEDCADPRVRRAKDLGELTDPGRWLSKQVMDLCRQAGARWGRFPAAARAAR